MKETAIVPTKTNLKERIVIIGAGMAGSKLASELLSDTALPYQVTLIGAEPQAGYNRILLSSLLAQEMDTSQMALVDIQAMKEQGAEIITGDAVIAVCTEKKRVTLQSQRQFFYDKLIFATGSNASKLPIAGHDAVNVACFRNWHDVEVFSALPKATPVCVIGAGLLGLEAAVGLVKQGHKVTVVHRAASILNRQLDSTAAGLLQTKLEQMGIEFCLKAAPEALLTTSVKSEDCTESDKTRVTKVRLSSGKSVPTSFVVMATGITPEIKLAKQAGLTVTKAIHVNEFMETSQQDVYAIGECTQFENVTFGLVAPIWQQLDCLLAQLRIIQNSKAKKKVIATENTPSPLPFRLEPIPTKLKVSGIQLFSVGDYHLFDQEDFYGEGLHKKPSYKESTGLDEQHTSAKTHYITLLDMGQHHYRKLIIQNNVLIGVILFGDVSDGNWFFELIQQKTPLTACLDTVIFGEAYNQTLGQPLITNTQMTHSNNPMNRAV